MSLDIICRTSSKYYVVFSDSLFSLQAIESCKVENPLIIKILKDHSQLINSDKSITFCWIPSRVGIRGNENADSAVNAELDVAISNMRYSVSDLLTCVNQLCVKECNNCGASVHQINFTVCNRLLVAVLVRHWAATTLSLSTVFEYVIQDLQIFISKRERVSQYVKLAILRSQSSTFFIDCTRYSAAGQRYFGVDTLKNVFENVASRNIIAYVKDIGFNNRI